MSSELTQKFRREINTLEATLLGVPRARAEIPWRAGGWTRKQILGHMLDSATNNLQRFVRAAAEGHYSGPKYAQDAWVAAHGYAEQEWETLVRWWQVEHEILAAVVERIPEEWLGAECAVGDNEPLTLRFLIEDYLTNSSAVAFCANDGRGRDRNRACGLIVAFFRRKKARRGGLFCLP